MLTLTNLYPPPADPDARLTLTLSAAEHRQLGLLSNSASCTVAGMTAYFCGDQLRGLLRDVLARASAGGQ